MDDVSVLLNLTGKVAFERTDPLMDLVSGHGPFLFYDQLSLERFPLAQEEQEKYVKQLLVSLRNLLESRRLSAEDQGGKIRLHIILDLVGNFMHQPEQTYCFPAQKVCRFKEMVRSVFERDTYLLRRFDYCFIFLECDSDDRRESDFYRLLAYNGCDGVPDEWLTAEMMSVNASRDRFIASLHSPSDDLKLDDSAVQKQYAVFKKELDERVARIATMLAKAGVNTPFQENVLAACARLKTIGDVLICDFDSMLRSTVCSLLGLCASSSGDCSFIIFKHRTGTVSQRRADEMVLSSLLQLLGTMSDEDYQSVMGLLPSKAATMYIINASANANALNTEALNQLKETVAACLPKMRRGGSLRWTKDKTVSYKQYSAKNVDPIESNVYNELNEKADKKRKELYDEFLRLRKVPFFFGSSPGDWQWFNSVCAILDELFSFEGKHDRPIHDATRRITDEEMDCESKLSSYVELEDLQDRLQKEQTTSNPLADLNSYLKEREISMEKFIALKNKLKTEMVKLGFASTTFWMALFCSLSVILCYAFHFFYMGNAENPIWIAACAAVVCLIVVIAAPIARSPIKSAIADVFNQINDCLIQELQGKQKAYLNTINRRISEQNKADIRKKNLDEVKGKLDEFNWHDLQVDLWEAHFASMDNKLSEMMQYAGKGTTSGTTTSANFDDQEFDTENMPYLPSLICRQFQSMTTVFASKREISGITCFLHRLEATCVNQ
jgi:hypothetical protein